MSVDDSSYGNQGMAQRWALALTSGLGGDLGTHKEIINNRNIPFLLRQIDVVEVNPSEGNTFIIGTDYPGVGYIAFHGGGVGAGHMLAFLEPWTGHMPISPGMKLVFDVTTDSGAVWYFTVSGEWLYQDVEQPFSVV